MATTVTIPRHQRAQVSWEIMMESGRSQMLSVDRGPAGGPVTVMTYEFKNVATSKLLPWKNHMRAKGGDVALFFLIVSGVSFKFT